MDIWEFQRLFEWLERHGTPARVKYGELAGILSHNASQPEKQPVSEKLGELKQTLDAMPLERLTSQQIDLLEHFNISNLFGESGVRFVQETVEIGEFDPATAAKEIQDAQSRINNTLKLAASWKALFKQLDFPEEEYSVDEGRLAIRIQFQADASISDVRDWKKWSSEWHDIVRGIGFCIGEAPENARVVGAGTGSIIVVLSATAAFTTLLSIIYRQISHAIKDQLVIANAIEELRHKKILNNHIEDELNRMKQEISDKGIEDTVERVKQELKGQIDGEAESAVRKAIQKLVKFNDLGGDVDIVAPSGEEDSEESAAELPSEIREVRRIAEEIRSVKSEIRLLTHDEEDGDNANRPA